MFKSRIQLTNFYDEDELEVYEAYQSLIYLDLIRIGWNN